jgi:branched-chain amino acid transport system substrate-binding protein
MQGSISRRAVLRAGTAAGVAAALPRRVRAAGRPIRIGVLTDTTGAYAANTGLGSVLGAQMAVEDFMRANASIKAEIVQADLQLKPDVAVSIARDWFDNQDVDVVTDVPLSSAAFAIGDLAKQKDKLAIFTGGASADITGPKCGPNHLHWVYDTWSMPHGVVDAAVHEGADSWFFITADYAFGHSLQKDAASFVTAANGKVLGQALAPFPGTTDFSSFLVQARASGAKAIGLANGGTDTVNCIKQAAEFGIMKGGQKVAGLILLIHDVHGVGAGRVADRAVLLEPECRHARIRQTVRVALQRCRPRFDPCRAVFGGDALSPGCRCNRCRACQGQRIGGHRADEGSTDR